MDMNDFKLDTNPKIKSGFEIPEDYFDTFSTRLMENMPKEPKVISFYDRNKSWIYSAAAILVLAFTIPVMNQFSTNSDVVSNMEVENYLANHSTITDDDIVNLLDKEDIDKIALETPISTLTTDDMMSQNIDIESYLTN